LDFDIKQIFIAKEIKMW